MLKLYRMAFAILLLILIFPLSGKEPVRLKDIAIIQGVKENQLMGFGLVTGLQGMGDSKNFGLTRKMLLNLTENYGFTLEADELKSKNVAAVLVTARIGGFIRVGDKVDITISSVGDAKSLTGGILLMTALKAPNGEVYAVAQGRLIAGTKKQKAETTASIPEGAIVEREYVSQFLNEDQIRIVLKNPDFSTANLVKEAVLSINPDLQVEARDAGLVEVKLGEEEKSNPVNFISQLELLTVVPDYKAVVVIDKKSGVIVTGSDVIIQECSVSTPNVQVNVGSRGGDTGKKGSFQISSKSVGELVTILNEAKLEIGEIIALLEAIHKLGAMNAELVIL